MAAHNRKNLTGIKFGYLTVTGYAFTKNKRAYWSCICQCGANKSILGKNLLNGLTVSCGCYNRSLTASRNYVHGMRYTSEYSIWKDMKKRCYNENHWAYSYYGGRGIKVCEEWLNDFMCFYNDMGSRPKGLTIDRIDNNGDYSKENCKWSTRLEQSNNRSDTIKLEFGGGLKTLTQISEITGISRDKLYYDFRNNKGAMITTLNTKLNNPLP